MLNVLFSAPDGRWAAYENALQNAFARFDLNVALATDHPAANVDYIVYAPGGSVVDFAPYVRARAVLGLWAGVEKIVTNTTLTQPLTRMVDHGLTQGMVEWVCGHTLRHHLGMDRHIAAQDGQWRPHTPPLAGQRKVTVLGLGALGAACATALSGLGFAVTGWARSAKDIAGIRCLSGPSGLDLALDSAEIVILLLPLTAETENMLNSDSIARLARGAFVINPGRGPLIDDAALIAALDNGQLSHATLDVFRIEPLPAAHPFWSHPGVTVTPHIAAETRPETAAMVIAENIHRDQTGLHLRHIVDRSLGY